MASNTPRLLELCARALALPSSARSAFLENACDGDSDLRRSIEALLAEEARAQDFLETPAWLPGRESLDPGRQLGPYEIVSLVGCGGMGEVYRARDTRLGRSVALKVLPRELAVDPARRARLRREGRAVSALNHPHICTLYDVGTDEGLDYLVMEYLEGETLAVHVSRGPVPLGSALEYATQLADAVAFAHGRGLIHRDLKPANVMITPLGAKILDFGVAKIDARVFLPTPADRSSTREGLVIGTLAYMAPEQLRGQPADERSDIFSLGAVLYEMFSGRRAFQGESVTTVIAAILETDPPLIASLQPGIPAAVDRVVGRCLEKKASTRWPRAADLAEELRRLHANESASTRFWPLPRRFRRQARWALAAVVGAVLLAAGVRVLWPVQPSVTKRITGAVASGEAPGTPGAADPFGPTSNVFLTAVTHESGAESFPSLSPDGREFVYATGPLDFFGESDIYRRDVGLDRAFNLTPDSPGADTQPAFSPDGNLIAFRSDREGGGLFVMRRDGSAVRRLTNEGYNPVWSPDGAEIAYATVQTMASPFANSGNGSSVWAVNVESGARRLIRKANAAQPAWSPHGYRLAYWTLGVIYTCTADGQDAVVAADATKGDTGRPASWNPVWSPNGEYLYFISNRNGPMHLWRVRIDERSGRPLEPAAPAPIQMPSTFVAHPGFDASGERLVFASVPLQATIKRASFDVARGVLQGNLEAVTTSSLVSVWPEPSPDGTRLAFQTMGETEDIYVSAADGSNPRLVASGAGVYRVPRWSPDGRRIAFYTSRSGHGNIWAVDADGGHLRQVTFSTRAPMIFPSWSPDGRMAGSEIPPSARSLVFDPDAPWDERVLTRLPSPDAERQFVPWSWSPDGRWLAGFARHARGSDRNTHSGVVLLDVETGTFTKVTADGAQPTPIWLPDGRRLLYAVANRVKLVDLQARRSREILNVGAARLEAAAGGGFSLAATTGFLYVAPVSREGDIWMAHPLKSRP